MNANGGLQRWVAARASAWQEILPALQRLERGRTDHAQEILTAVDNYRSLGRDLSVARRVLPASRLTRALEQRYARLHAVIHRKPIHWPSRLLTLFRDEIPAVVHELRPTIAWVSTLFVLATLAGWWLISSFPELISILADERMITGVEQGRLWTENGMFSIVPASLASIGILTNNIMVSIMALSLGVLFGLGTFYIVTFNGLSLGALFAFTAQHGLADDLFKFVIAHGIVELSVICISSAAGVMIGESLIRPGHGTRLESFQYAAKRVARLMLLCAILLVGCGFIEGVISLNTDLSFASRTLIGVAYGCVMVMALTGRLFGRHTAVTKSAAT